MPRVISYLARRAPSPRWPPSWPGATALAARFPHIALTGGCFQNRILFEEVNDRLKAENFTVLSHARLPANDGGLALGQAAIGAARLIRAQTLGEGNATCVSEFPAAS